MFCGHRIAQRYLLPVSPYRKSVTGSKLFAARIAVSFSSVDEMTVSHSRGERASCTPSPARCATDAHLQLNPESELNYARLMQYNACYEAMPTSSKMVVFDTNLQLRKAFNGLIYQNTRHVLLSDPDYDGTIVGILSVTDFIRVLLRLYKNRKGADEDVDDKNELTMEELNQSDSSIFANDDIGKLAIKEYRELIQHEGKLMDLVSINADERVSRFQFLIIIKNHAKNSALEHGQALEWSGNFIHRILINVTLELLVYLTVFPWDLIQQHGMMVFPDTPLVDCLDILLHKGVSGLPVVERNTYKVVDMYSRFDAIGIALEDKINQLDVTVEQALAFKNSFRQQKDRVVSVYDSDSLWTALTVLVERNVHRLCAIRKSGAIEGLISLSDVINFMVIKPGTNLSTNSPSHHPRLNHHNSSLGSELNTHDVLSRLEESAAQLEQRATGQINKQLAAFSMD
ncbi:5'-AMP-activated protein kinase subunit gamma-2 [Toxocara canis]|uniref:5'-AMP-activated protein kinase subunit gamma-2 n=1 Tax=Toxocara canis TaxID=6265 RepID=A0A0B2W0P6_TOXCA|nr:5'-AMP-activated protein kinase subunit gamma-2 [Toxocara canis]